MNAASSTTNSDKASERPASGEDAIAFTCEPFFNLSDSLLSSTEELPPSLNQTGNKSCITLTFSTKFFATVTLVAITNALKS